MRAAPVTPSFLATDLTHCARCGESTVRGYWLLDGVALHTACVDWEARPYPYAWAVELARVLVRKAPDDVELRAAARVVWEMGRRWPQDAIGAIDRAGRAVLVLTVADQRLRAS